jgi:hypothetical protein
MILAGKEAFQNAPSKETSQWLRPAQRFQLLLEIL